MIVETGRLNSILTLKNHCLKLKHDCLCVCVDTWSVDRNMMRAVHANNQLPDTINTHDTDSGSEQRIIRTMTHAIMMKDKNKESDRQEV